MILSFIVPCYNEAENIAAFQKAVANTFDGCKFDYELVFIDDGSQDTTYDQLKSLYQEQPNAIKVIRFTRNFGKEAAIYAGLKYASGTYICIIDADLQQPPAVALEMAKILDAQKEYDIVAAYQKRRKERKFLSFLKIGFYGVINKLSDVEFKSQASDFRVFRRCVAESILSIGEYHRFAKGIFAWVGYNTCFIPYIPEKRKHGKSKWGVKKLTNYAIDGIIGYSTRPLRIASLLGSLTSFAAIIYLIAVVWEKLTKGIDVPGYATVIVLILFLGSMQLFCIGIIGEYVGRTFEQSKQRPIYIEKEVLTNASNDTPH